MSSYNTLPSIYGINNSNRDFTSPDTWGKNQFNSSFPVGLINYMHSLELNSLYIKIDKNLKTEQCYINANDLYNFNPQSPNLHFSFESCYTPYQKYLIGHLPRADLVINSTKNGNCYSAFEIKLTALPDHTTCTLPENRYGSELVIRPDTIVYLACSIASKFENNRGRLLNNFFTPQVNDIKDWSNGNDVWGYLPDMIKTLKKIIIDLVPQQEPLLLQPVWKTQGKSPRLADFCLDSFVWSNLAFIKLFLNTAEKELRNESKITRQIRTIIWLYKMLFDYASCGKINHEKIIDNLSYNTKNDKAFSISGRLTYEYMNCSHLSKPRIQKNQIRNIILGGGQNMLSPERRFDAIIYNSPELFI